MRVPAQLRNVNFQKDILFQIAGLLSIVPDPDVSPDAATQWTGFVNSRMREAWEAWDWPELCLTEERAFRTIWNASKQFYIVDPLTQQPSELFYLPNYVAQTAPYYFVVNSGAPGNPPIGTLPTNTVYFSPLDPVDSYVAYDQNCRRAIGQVFGVYRDNPRVNWRPFPLNFRPSEYGIDVAPCGGATVFVHFKLRPSTFTTSAWSSTTTYNDGDVVYWTDGNCYRSTATGNLNNTPGVSQFWALVPCPYVIAEFVKRAAAGDAADDQQEAALLITEAQEYLRSEIDKLLSQGEHHLYGARRRWFRWGSYVDAWFFSTSPPFPNTGVPVTTLTDVCEDSGGPALIPSPAPLQAEMGITPLITGQDYIDVVFNLIKLNNLWRFSELEVQNTVDPSPLKIYWTTIINRTTTGFRVLLNAAPNTVNYSLQWSVGQQLPGPVSLVGEGNVTPMILGQNYLLVSFLNPKPANWDFINLTVENTIDPTPQLIFPTICTVHSTTQFQIWFNSPPPTGNYVLRWRVNYQ